MITPSLFEVSCPQCGRALAVLGLAPGTVEHVCIHCDTPPGAAVTPARPTRPMHFDGPAFNAAIDGERLTKQLGRIHGLMRDGIWRTLDEIASSTGDPAASVSAQLRHLRKPRFGGF